jgi:hypothetical protein
MHPIDHDDIASRFANLLRQSSTEPRVESRNPRCESSGHGRGCDRDDEDDRGAHRSVARSVMSELRERLGLGDDDEDDDIQLTTARIASALRSAVSAARSPGDPVPASLDAIENGLANAERSLAQRGFSTREIEQALGSFREELADRIDALAEQETAPSADAFAAIAAEYQRRESASLEIRTQQGDVVELRIRNRSELEVESAYYRDGELSAASFAVEQESRLEFEIDIDGELNAEESAAVRALVTRAESLANRFWNTDVGQAFELGAALDYDESLLAGFRMHLAVAERYTLAGFQSPEPAAAPEVPDAAAAAPSAPATASASAPASESAAPASNPAPSATPAETPVPTPLDPVEAISETIRDFLRDLTGPKPLGSSLRLTQQARLDFLIEGIGLGRPEAPSSRTGFDYLLRILEGFAPAPAPELPPAGDATPGIATA